MENNPSTLKAHIIQYGLLLGGVSVVFALMLFFLDMHYTQESAVNWINWFITTAVLVLAIINYRKSNEGFLSLSEALKLGLGVSVISALIAIAYTFVLTNFLDPDTIEKTLEISQNKMLDEYPEMTQEQIDQAKEMQRKFSSIGVISTMIIIFSLLFGFVVSLISGLILKRNRPE
ncbi:MAG: DUF4199 domain-containing protein [Flavobacteriaceae bacterium]